MAREILAGIAVARLDDLFRRALGDDAMDVVNLKISKLGGLTRTWQLRDLCLASGIAVTLEDTIKAFKGIVAGDYDDLPEASFYMVGTIDEAVAKAKKLAAEAA